MDYVSSKKWRKVLGGLAYAIGLLCIGGWLALSWVAWRFAQIGASLDDATDLLVFLALALSVVSERIDPDRRHGVAVGDPGANWIGTLVVASTGAGLSIAFWTGAMFGKEDHAAGLVTAAITALICVVVWRFALTNGDRIGEARFETTRD